MIQDIFPHVFHNEFHERESLPGDFVAVFSGGKTYLSQGGALPTAAEIKALGVKEHELVYLFEIDQTAFFLLWTVPDAVKRRWWSGHRHIPQYETYLSGSGRVHGPAPVRLVSLQPVLWSVRRRHGAGQGGAGHALPQLRPGGLSPHQPGGSWRRCATGTSCC